MASITIAAGQGLVTLSSSWRVYWLGLKKMTSEPTTGTGRFSFDLSGIPKNATITSASLSCSVQMERGTYTVAGGASTRRAVMISKAALQSGSYSAVLTYKGKPTGAEAGGVLPGALYTSFCAFRGGSLTVNYTVSGGGSGGGDSGSDIGQNGGLIHAVPPERKGSQIMLYSAGTWDFSWNGTALQPLEARVEEEENGNFSASITLAMDERGLWRNIGYRDLLRIPCPARNTLGIKEAEDGKQYFEKYEVLQDGNARYLYSGPDAQAGKRLCRLDGGMELYKLSGDEQWIRATVAANGMTGYAEASGLQKIAGSVAAEYFPRLQERDQLFRIYDVSADTESREVTIEARHIFYDLMKAIMIGSDAKMEKLPLAQALQRILDCADHPLPFHFYTDCEAEITGDFRGKNAAEALLDPENGIAAATKCYLCRDNLDIHLIADPGEDRGIRIQHGRNCLGAKCTWGSENTGNRIIAKMGDSYTVHDAPGLGENEDIMAVFRSYDKKDGTAEEQAAREFEKGLQGTDLEMDVDFILLSNTAAHRRYAGLQALYLGDTVHLSLPQGSFDSRLSSYVYNPMLQQYEEVHIGITAAGKAKGSIGGYRIGSVGAVKITGQMQNEQLADGIITAEKIAAGAIAAEKIAAGAIEAEKIAAGAIAAEKIAAGAIEAEKIAAEAIQARHLSAGAVEAEKIASDAIFARHLSADALDAASAHILKADIDWAEIESLQAAIAKITSAEIQNADIDFSRIKDLNADTAIITKGNAGELYISRLSVTEANLVSLSVGQLMVKGADGAFYALSVDETGAVKAEKKLIENGDIRDLSIDAGQKIIEGSVTAATLNAREIFGESALIRELIASTLDVDTLFAREAMIAKINALDITGNESIRLYVKSQEEMSAFLRVTENGLEIGRVGDTATFRADNRTLEVTNVKTERLGLAQRMSQKEEWAVSAYNSGLSIKWIGGDA